MKSKNDGCSNRMAAMSPVGTMITEWSRLSVVRIMRASIPNSCPRAGRREGCEEERWYLEPF